MIIIIVIVILILILIGNAKVERGLVSERVHSHSKPSVANHYLLFLSLMFGDYSFLLVVQK